MTITPEDDNGQNEKLLSSTFYRTKRRGTTIDPQALSFDANEKAMKLAYFSSNGTLSPRKKCEKK